MSGHAENVRPSPKIVIAITDFGAFASDPEDDRLAPTQPSCRKHAERIPKESIQGIDHPPPLSFFEPESQRKGSEESGCRSTYITRIYAPGHKKVSSAHIS